MKTSRRIALMAGLVGAPLLGIVLPAAGNAPPPAPAGAPAAVTAPPAASGHVHAQPTRTVRPPAERRGPAGGNSSYPTVAFAADGRLFAAFAEGDFVNVSVSSDKGKTFGKAVVVNPQAEKLDMNGEGRPKVAVAGDNIYVSWTEKLEKPHTGNIRFSRSLDAGKTFSAPVTVNDDGIVTGHRFDALGVDPKGQVHIVWVDKRDREKALAAGGTYEGAALYHAVSRDSGKTFAANRKLKDNICECCRLALTFDGSGTPVVLWRDILPGGIRDHSLLRITDPPTPSRRATVDDWAINACPHHGPSLSVAGDGTEHMVWFTAGTRSTGLYYARTTPDGKTSEPLKFGSVESSRYPFVLARGADVWIAWKEAIPGGGHAVMVRRSTNGGAQFGEAREWARSATRATDHPLLVAGPGGTPYLSWFSDGEGYRAWPLS